MTDVKRRGIDSWVNKPAVAGKPLRLTIDDRLQFLAERELAAQVVLKHGRTGTAIIMNPNTGEILVMANYPTFDPNKPPIELRGAPRALQSRRSSAVRTGLHLQSTDALHGARNHQSSA